MDSIKVKDLERACKLLCKKGLGDKKILISSDDEGNSYHVLFSLFSLGYYPDNEQLPIGVNGRNISEYIVLG